MTISGERTEQLDIFCRVTGFTSDFLSFTDVELIRFFHGAIQLLPSIWRNPSIVCYKCISALSLHCDVMFLFIYLVSLLKVIPLGFLDFLSIKFCKGCLVTTRKTYPCSVLLDSDFLQTVVLALHCKQLDVFM